ncbi:MAG: recombinase family protein [Firmicutes bacterium]|nr:recombinase family protein [Bacillota bacterium]
MKTKNKAKTGKITAIYVRRSVSDKFKDNNSLSIEAQKEDCVRYVGEKTNYRIYCDDGKSGKDTAHRPEFQQMMADAKDGLIECIVVKKYDRFSRNMREYLNISDELDKLGIAVYSLSEPFNTATKEGRMMRNNLLNFAEFERETIASRVADSYNTKARETGFYQGGFYYYGFMSERRTINGKTGSVLVPSPQAESVKIAYDLYKKNDVSLNDIIVYFRENNIDTTMKSRKAANGVSNMCRGHISRILQSPLYVRADKEVYRYLMSKGYELVDDVSAYDGVHGIFLHTKSDGGKYAKIGYHEGLVDAETWLTVQDKKDHNVRIKNNGKVEKSWLVGLVKCAHCHYSMILSSGNGFRTKKKYLYYYDAGAYKQNGCVKKHPKMRPDQLEKIVFEEMKKRIDSLVIAKKESESPNSEIEKMKEDILRIDNEIKTYLDKLKEADNILFDYISQRVKELHTKKLELENKVCSRERKHKRVCESPLVEPMSHWDELTTQEKHDLAVTVIEVIYISDETGVDIHFSI